MVRIQRSLKLVGYCLMDLKQYCVNNLYSNIFNMLIFHLYAFLRQIVVMYSLDIFSSNNLKFKKLYI